MRITDLRKNSIYYFNQDFILNEKESIQIYLRKNTGVQLLEQNRKEDKYSFIIQGTPYYIRVDQAGIEKYISEIEVVD